MGGGDGGGSGDWGRGSFLHQHRGPREFGVLDNPVEEFVNEVEGFRGGPWGPLIQDLLSS